MCLTPIRIRNRARHYEADGMQRRWLTVPCGHCAECIAQKRQQWYMRNYWHCKECYDKGGFVLFETLTYDDEHLPHLSEFIPSLEGTALDFPCFDKRDLDLFFKRLRTNLTRAGYNITNGNLDYFYTSEYGSDDEYIDDRGRHRKATFRPHYHFLFYVKDPRLTPDDLAKWIYYSWSQGRTDSVDADGYFRRGYMYLHNVFSKKYGRKDDTSLRKVSNYVAKYVTKEPEYREKIEARISNSFSELMSLMPATELFDFIDYLGYSSFSEFEEDYRKRIASYVDMFHNQSQGFGKYALDFKCIRDGIFNDGVVRIPDDKRIVASVPVPLYYVRKLYCHLSDALPGHHEWHWTMKGEKYLAKRAERSIKLAADKYQSAFLNMTPDNQRCVISLLGEGVPYLTNLPYYTERFRALAEYELFRRDRFAPVTKPLTTATAVAGSSFRLCPGKAYAFITDDDGSLWKLKAESSTFEENRYDTFMRLYREMEQELYDGCDLPVVQSFKPWHPDNPYSCDYEYVPPEEEHRYLCSDFTFDAVLDCFACHFEPLNAEKQKTFDEKERLKKTFSKN